MEIKRGERSETTNNGKPACNDWYKLKLNMDSVFCGKKEGLVVEILTLDDLFNNIEQTTGVRYQPVAVK